LNKQSNCEQPYKRLNDSQHAMPVVNTTTN
jgi:hypothetical protein